MWRGGLPPLGCEAALKPETSLHLTLCVGWIATAAQSNGDKSPHHRDCGDSEIPRWIHREQARSHKGLW
ncbi:hypothetical protein EYC95_12735 [Pseudomonas sp. BGI-2]|nr:hypothetical protein EYC95_12735 [Pseudomonas sp. BGI-2]